MEFDFSSIGWRKFAIERCDKLRHLTLMEHGRIRKIRYSEVLTLLLKIASFDMCYMSIPELSKETGICKRNISRINRALAEAGLMTIESQVIREGKFPVNYYRIFYSDMITMKRDVLRTTRSSPAENRSQESPHAVDALRTSQASGGDVTLVSENCSVDALRTTQASGIARTTRVPSGDVASCDPSFANDTSVDQKFSPPLAQPHAQPLAQPRAPGACNKRDLKETTTVFPNTSIDDPWKVVVVSLEACDVLLVPEAVAGAKCLGFDPAQCHALIDYWRRSKLNHNPGVLYNWLTIPRSAPRDLRPKPKYVDRGLDWEKRRQTLIRSKRLELQGSQPSLSDEQAKELDEFMRQLDRTSPLSRST